MKKVLIIMVCVVLGVIILAVGLIGLTSATSKKMKCTSSQGNITIMYNDDTIKGYTATNFDYDLDGQKEYAKKVGIESYLDEFKTWFETNTTGTCSR